MEKFRNPILIVIALAVGVLLYMMLMPTAAAPPVTFVIDKRGNIVFRLQGEPDFARLHVLIEEKLNEPA